jgi:hypothetical protein
MGKIQKVVVEMALAAASFCIRHFVMLQNGYIVQETMRTWSHRKR